MINSVEINNTKSALPISTQQHPVMRGTTSTLERTPNEDTVIVKPKKQKLSTATKIGIGITAALGTLVGTAVLISRHQTSKLKKLYDEKLVLSSLPERLEFKEAQTLEEAIAFAKETLRIPEIDNNFTLEALNFANRGIVDVSNANKGKLFLPRKMRYDEYAEDTIASVIMDIESKEFGNLLINPKFFDSKFLNERIKDLLVHSDNTHRFNFKNGELYSTSTFLEFTPIPNTELCSLIKRYYENPENLNIKEKRLLWSSLSKGFGKLYGRSNKPEKINEYTNTVMELIPPERTIYHEMGHLQDFAKNLKKLDIMQWEFNIKKIWQNSLEKAKNGKESTNRTGVLEIDNRWSRKGKKGIDKLLEEKPEKLKKHCPDLYEFLTNKEIQATAGEVSNYAQSGIGEFVAECYAEMISGKKLPDKVMELYRKYGGPTIG